MQKEIFKQGLAVLCATFTDRKFNAKVYWELLNDIDDKQFLLAIKDVCSTITDVYPGTNLIAVIRDRALSGTYKLSGEAWEDVLKEVSRVGHWGDPKFEDKLTEKAVNCIGWKEICASELIGVERSHFIKAYDQMASREKSEDVKPEECKKINIEQKKKLNELTGGIA